MNEKISIIIPVYNVEKYLKECLESIINQSYNNIEIIIINDGSTDNSKDICKEFSKFDKRIIYIEETNHGVSHARNIGLEKATGNYIAFVDSDDWVNEKMIEILYKNAIKYNSDIIACDYFICKDNSQIEHSLGIQNEVITNKEQMYNKLFSTKYYGGYLWNKLIKRECIFKDNKVQIKFNEDIKIEEDTLFIANILRNVKKIVYLPSEKLYYYRIRNNSAVRFNYSKKDLSKLKSLKEFIKIKNKYNLKTDNKLEYEIYTLARQGKYIIKKEKIVDIEYIDIIKKVSKKYFLIALKEAEAKEKIKVLLLKIFPITYSKINHNIKTKRK